MKIETTDRWNLLNYTKANVSQNQKQIKDVVLQLKDQQIKIDSVEFSKEGMEALRSKVQSMPGRIDVEEIKRMQEILPKLRMNPEDDFYWEMRKNMQDSLDGIKMSKGSYTLEDLITIRMDAYTKQYGVLQNAYDEGSRDIYISEMGEKDKFQFHKVTQEDFSFLNQAFYRIADSLMFSASAQEMQWKINETFGGEKGLGIALPKGYGERLSGILKRAASVYEEQRREGKNIDASSLAIKYLNEDKEFANAMYKLFSNMKPM